MPEDVKAHITGVVFQITTQPGDAVAAGDAVIVLEVHEDGDSGGSPARRQGARDQSRRGTDGAGG